MSSICSFERCKKTLPLISLINTDLGAIFKRLLLISVISVYQWSDFVVFTSRRAAKDSQCTAGKFVINCGSIEGQVLWIEWLGIRPASSI
jgi:hypothetical protein